MSFHWEIIVQNEPEKKSSTVLSWKKLALIFILHKNKDVYFWKRSILFAVDEHFNWSSYHEGYRMQSIKCSFLSSCRI